MHGKITVGKSKITKKSVLLGCSNNAFGVIGILDIFSQQLIKLFTITCIYYHTCDGGTILVILNVVNLKITKFMLERRNFYGTIYTCLYGR